MNRYGAILFIEKQGFAPLFEQMRLAERYDISVMSTKGMSVTASRSLVDTICATCAAQQIPLLVLRDFDKAGFSIVDTLRRDTRRFRFANPVKVIDLGLRLSDVEAHQLKGEDVHYKKGKKNGGGDPRPNLRTNGATNAEVEYLCSYGDQWYGYRGKRVELNEFSPKALVGWIEKKLHDNGIKKVIPESDVLEIAFRRAAHIVYLNDGIRTVTDSAIKFAEGARVPKGLRKSILSHLKENPADSWDQAVAAQVRKLDLGGDE